MKQILILVLALCSFNLYSQSYKKTELTISGGNNSGISVLGAELLTSSNWTSTGWTGNFASGFTHSTGNTSVLSNTLNAIINQYYIISYTVTGRTAGTFSIDFGGYSASNLTSSATVGPKATTTGNLQITPTTDFNGTIVISIKIITSKSLSSVMFKNTNGLTTNEIRISNVESNLIMGLEAGEYNYTGTDNLLLGYQAGKFNTTGFGNIAIGGSALENNTLGWGNIAIGASALLSNTTANRNIAIGASALVNNTGGPSNQGNFNIAIGGSSMQSNTIGAFNTAIGFQALDANTSGSSNIAIGYDAGRGGGSVNANTTGSNNIYIGNGVVGLANNESWTAYYGSSSMTKHVFQGGNVGIGNTSPASRLVVQSPSTSVPVVSVISAGSGDVSNPALVIQKFDNNTSTSQIFVRFNINNTNTGSGTITANGANTAAFGSTSDVRVKENIVNLESQINKIMALRPVEFDYVKSFGGGHQIGFIAQELEKIYPDAVSEGEDGIKMIAGWSKTESRLVKAIQEQQFMIENQKTEIETLKTQLQSQNDVIQALIKRIEALEQK